MSKSSEQPHLNTVFEHFEFIDDNLFYFLIGCSISESGAKPGDVISGLYHNPRCRAISIVRVQIMARFEALGFSFHFRLV